MVGNKDKGNGLDREKGRMGKGREKGREGQERIGEGSGR